MDFGQPRNELFHENGFRQSRSTGDLLVFVSHPWQAALDDHSTLLMGLFAFGFPPVRFVDISEPFPSHSNPEDAGVLLGPLLAPSHSFINNPLFDTLN